MTSIAATLWYLKSSIASALHSAWSVFFTKLGHHSPSSHGTFLSSMVSTPLAMAVSSSRRPKKKLPTHEPVRAVGEGTIVGLTLKSIVGIVVSLAICTYTVTSFVTSRLDSIRDHDAEAAKDAYISQQDEALHFQKQDIALENQDAHNVKTDAVLSQLVQGMVDVKETLNDHTSLLTQTASMAAQNKADTAELAKQVQAETDARLNSRPDPFTGTDAKLWAAKIRDANADKKAGDPITIPDPPSPSTATH